MSDNSFTEDNVDADNSINGSDELSRIGKARRDRLRGGAFDIMSNEEIEEASSRILGLIESADNESGATEA